MTAVRVGVAVLILTAASCRLDLEGAPCFSDANCPEGQVCRVSTDGSTLRCVTGNSSGTGGFSGTGGLSATGGMPGTGGINMGIGGSTEDSGTTDSGARLALSSDVLLFSGPRGVTTGTQGITVTNVGTEATGPLAVVTSNSAFNRNTTCGQPLAPMGSCDIAVSFTPSALGQVSGTIRVEDDAGLQATSTLTGTGLVPVTLSGTPSPVEFGPQLLGVAARRTVRVTNEGAVTSQTVSGIVLGDAEFSLPPDSGCPALDAGATCQFEVVFTPSAAAPATATLRLRAGSAMQDVVLNGTGVLGPVLAFVPSTPVNVGALAVGVASSPVSIALQNVGGSATLGAPALSLSSQMGATFTVTGCPLPLAPGERCQADVRATPTQQGPLSAVLRASSGITTATVTVGGTASAPPNLVWDTTSYDFGNVATNSNGIRSFTLRNDGGAPSGPLSISTLGNQYFQVSAGNCGASLSANGSCTVDVSFRPDTQSTFTGSLNASANPGGTTTASLRGQGVAATTLTVSASPASFAPTAIGNRVFLSFVVRNAGAVPTTLPPSATIVGPSANQFSVQRNDCTAVLATGAQCIIRMEFQPLQAGQREATLLVNAGNAQGSAPLSGIGQSAAALRFLPPSLTLPSTVVGQTSLAQSFRIENIGDQSTSFTLNGGTADFPVNVNSMCPNPLPGNSSCELTVAFQPTVAGARMATITLSAGSVSQDTLRLTGTGLTPARLQSMPGALNFGSIEVNTTAVLTVAIINSGQEESGPLGFGIGGDFNATRSAQNPCEAGNRLAVGASCNLDVSFRPTATGLANQRLTVLSNPGGEAVISLEGTGLAPPQLATSVAHNFQMVRIGSRDTYAWVIRNTGGLPTSLLSVSALNPPYTVMSDSCSAQTLAAGAACTIEIQFAPTSLNRGGTATLVVSATQGGNVTASIDGTGGHQLTVTPPDTSGVAVAAALPGFPLQCSSANQTCTTILNPGTQVSLVALTSNGSDQFFRGWRSPSVCSGPGEGRRCTFALNADHTVTAEFSPIDANLAFVSSVAAPANLGLSGFDSLCNRLAGDAGINNAQGTAFRAWVSIASSPATARFPNAGGFRRLDGEVIANSRGDLLDAKIRAPIDITEFNVKTKDALSTWTGTSGTGAHRPSQDCNSWMSLLGSLDRGLVRGGPGLWTEGTAAHTCANSETRVFCLMTTSANTLTQPAVPGNGSLAYLSDGLWTPGGGRNSADNHCSVNKPNAFPSRRYVALLSLAGETAAARLPPNTPYFSPQGTFLFNSDQLKTLARPQLSAGIWMTGNGLFVPGLQPVYTGAASPNQTSAAATPNCNDWTTTSGTSIVGTANVASENFFGISANSCATARRLYCVQIP